jgi:spore germination protein YaaH
MKTITFILLAASGLLISSCGFSSAKKELDKKTQEIYDLNRELLAIQQQGQQGARLAEQDIANKQKILEDIQQQEEIRENAIQGFFGRIFRGGGSTERKVNTPPGQQQSVIDRYDVVYNLLHEQQASEFADLAGGVSKEEVYERDSLRGTSQVFGWHPYWMNGAYQGYNYRLLSIISYFAYDVEPTNGMYRDPAVIQDWKTTGMIDSAKKVGCKVLLTVSNHGRSNNRAFLNNPIAQETLIDSLLFLVRFREADGVDIDFEAVPKGVSSQLTAFVMRLRARMQQVNPDYIVSMCLPAADPSQVFDLQALEPYVDYFVIMGYDLHGAASSNAGPVSPLYDGKPWKTPSLSRAVSTYLNKGAVRSKVILALPYYGTRWETSSNQPGLGQALFVEHLTYKEIRQKYDGRVAGYDAASHSRYLIDEEQGSFYQLWYDDSTTLDRKMDYIQKQGLGGVGIWALGYDNGLPEMWQLIGQRFGRDRNALIRAARASKRFGIISWIREYKSPLIASCFFLVFFLMLGFVLSLTDWRVRDALFFNGSSRAIYAGIFFAVVVAVLSFSGLVPGKSLVLAGGLFLGLALTFLISRITIRRRRELP